MKKTIFSIVSVTLILCSVSFAACSKKQKQENKTFSEYSDGVKDGHKYVDLDLPSGTLWATCNVGAETPEGFGDYFAWGETVGYGKEDTTNVHNYAYTKSSYVKNDYYWDSYKYCNGSEHNTLTKYNPNSSFGKVDELVTLEPSDDVATTNWGGRWRMPTYTEQAELRNNCYWVWTKSYNNTGVAGFIVYKAKKDSDKKQKSYREDTPSQLYTLSDAHIFLPAAGYRFHSDSSLTGIHGYYWSSSLGSVYPGSAYGLFFGSDYVDWGKYHRFYAQSVRAVCTIENK